MPIIRLAQHMQAECQPIIGEIQSCQRLSSQFLRGMQPHGNPVLYSIHTMRMLGKYVCQPDGDYPSRTQTFPIAVSLYHLIDDCLYAHLL